MELKIGQKLTRYTGLDKTATIEIIKLNVPERIVEFMVSGDDVIDPDKPRVMNIFSLAKWLESTPEPSE